MNKPVRTRMAPSPTGELHIGSLSVILKNYAFAKKHGGQFILRVEDTDKVREVAGAGERLMQVIHRYGLDWDEGPDKGGPHGPYTQSERLPLYVKFAQQLVEESKAYYCFCSKERLEKLREDAYANKVPPKYDRHCRSLTSAEVEKRLTAGEDCVIRLKVPDNQEIKFIDQIRGEIVINSDILDDQVLLKSDGFPTYHLAVVVDDHDMKITHIMRGEEWLSSTPKHILLYEAFGWEKPAFAHIPVYLNPDGQGKMSKRKGDVAAQSYLDKGYLPEAMLNFLMILGWTPQDQRDVVSLDEYIQEFDPSQMSKKSVAFDLKKLAWLNGLYIRDLYVKDQPELVRRLGEFLPADFPREKLVEILPLVYERLERLTDLEELTSFFYRDIEQDQELLLKKATSELVTNQLVELSEALAEGDWSLAAIEATLRDLQEKNNYQKSQYFMMVRLAVTGKKATPPLFETMLVLGRELVLARLRQAQTTIAQ